MSSMRIIPAALVSLGLCCAQSAIAQENVGSGLSYDYAELRFVDADIDGRGGDGDGFSLGGSYQVAPKFVVTGSYTDLEFDGDVDFSQLSVGGGYIHPYREKIDIVGYASIIRQELDAGPYDEDDTGIGLAGGIRALAAPQLELRATANYVNVDDSDTFIELGADYWLDKQFSVGISATLGGDLDTLTIGGRWFFNEG